MSQYQVITNPNNLIHKHEVWFAGEVDAQDSEGFRIKAPVIKKVKSFRSEAAAKGYIDYQIAVRSFREQAQASFTGNIRQLSKVAK